ncbi:MAG TPA: hypothetical protein PLR22_09785, partial [Saprospiraceae bacterium]|nr:hypothetical protein [Saprospiraceae bacterium]
MNFSFRTFLGLCLLVFSFQACENDLAEVRRVTGVSVSGSYEEGVDGEILYSDSARLKVVIKFDTLIRILDQSDPRDIFPRGLIVSFYDDNGQISSILTANRAE